MDSEHYPLALRLDGHTSYLLWVTGEEGDRVVVDRGRVVGFYESLLSLRAYAAEHRLDLAKADPEAVFDVDNVVSWLLGHEEPDPVAVLNTWNLAWDVANSTGAPFNHRGGARDAVYDKVFWANNLPAMSPPGEQYEPDWSSDELRLLREVVGEAVALIRTATAQRP
jgi:hypothetical protein